MKYNVLVLYSGDPQIPVPEGWYFSEFDNKAISPEGHHFRFHDINDNPEKLRGGDKMLDIRNNKTVKYEEEWEI
jgi:hypothetical protein